MYESRPHKIVPRECLFNSRMAGECVGCPALGCKHMRMPFADSQETHEIATRAALLVKAGRVRGFKPKESLKELTEILEIGLMLNMSTFRLNQALDAVALGLATIEQASRFAGVRTQTFNDRVPRTKTRIA